MVSVNRKIIVGKWAQKKNQEKTSKSHCNGCLRGWRTQAPPTPDSLWFCSNSYKLRCENVTFLGNTNQLHEHRLATWALLHWVMIIFLLYLMETFQHLSSLNGYVIFLLLATISKGKLIIYFLLRDIVKLLLTTKWLLDNNLSNESDKSTKVKISRRTLVSLSELCGLH